MKFGISKSTVIKLIKILKWGKVIAKLVALGTAVSGAITSISGSATTGIALSAAGATTYAATKGFPKPDYEKTRHVPPGRVDRAANMLRLHEMESARLQGRAGGPASLSASSVRMSMARSSLGMGTSYMPRKK